MLRTLSLLSAALAVAVLGLVQPALAQTKLYPPHSQVEGKTLASWGDTWWKRVYGIPAAQCPILDPDGRFGAIGQSGSVYFLYGTFGGNAERWVTISEEQKLFFPLFNYENDNYPFGDPNAPYSFSVETLRAQAAANIDTASMLFASVDGVPVTRLRYTNGCPVTNLFEHREQSDRTFAYRLPGDFTDLSSVLYGDTRWSGKEIRPAIADGYWLMLTPLSPGKHTVRFASQTSWGFDLDVTYHITVTRKRK